MLHNSNVRKPFEGHIDGHIECVFARLASAWGNEARRWIEERSI
jgi:hypothetical protein